MIYVRSITHTSLSRVPASRSIGAYKRRRMQVKIMRVIFQVFIVGLIAILFCNVGSADEETPDYWPTKGWKTASPESQGIDSLTLIRMLEMIWEKDFAIDSVLVVRNGYIVLDAYRFPFKADNTRHFQSCSKSVISALIGVAIDHGDIQNINQSILDFFPKNASNNENANKHAITIEHLLTMTHGWECNDLYRFSCISDLSCGGNWIHQVLDLPTVNAPGTNFGYCNGATVLLSAILQEQTGETALSFAEKHLFAPLGIADVHWPSNPQGITTGYNGLHMRPRDMAKIGYLYLNNGIWDGQRILSASWIQASTQSHIATHAGYCPGYGYQWWIISPGIYAAQGAQGQYMMIAQEKNMLTVFTGSLDLKDTSLPYGLLAAYLIPALKSPNPLPENPDALQELTSVATRWRHPRPISSANEQKMADSSDQSGQRHEYVNNEHRFTVAYDADLLIQDHHMESPVVLRRRGLQRGLPMLTVLVDNIQKNMLLEYTADYMLSLSKKILPHDYHNAYGKIEKDELITLSDGTNGNYVEIKWSIPSRENLKTVGVFAYKNNKVIGVIVCSLEETSVEYLAEIATSLEFFH